MGKDEGKSFCVANYYMMKMAEQSRGLRRIATMTHAHSLAHRLPQLNFKMPLEEQVFSALLRGKDVFQAVEEIPVFFCDLGVNGANPRVFLLELRVIGMIPYEPLNPIEHFPLFALQLTPDLLMIIHAREKPYRLVFLHIQHFDEPHLSQSFNPFQRALVRGRHTGLGGGQFGTAEERCNRNSTREVHEKLREMALLSFRKEVQHLISLLFGQQFHKRGGIAIFYEILADLLARHIEQMLVRSDGNERLF